MKVVKLFETYKSQKELEELSNTIIKYVAKETYNYHRDFIWKEPNWKEDPHSAENKIFKVDFKKETKVPSGLNYTIEKFDGNKVKFKGFEEIFNIEDVEMIWSDKNEFIFKQIMSVSMFYSTVNQEFEILNDFIDIMNTMIYFKKYDKVSVPKSTKGDFRFSLINKKIGPNEITLYYDDMLLKDLRIKKKETTNFDSSMIYTTLFFKFNDTLLHELQHAYDAYRSLGKALKKDKKFIEDFKRKEEIESKSNITEEDLEYISKVYKDYLNLPHEINARFIQAINRVSFYTIDFEGEDDDLKMYHIMYPLRDVIKDFKIKFHGWNQLSEKYKRKLIRKVSQFWHHEEEKIKNIDEK